MKLATESGMVTVMVTVFRYRYSKFRNKEGN